MPPGHRDDTAQIERGEVTPTFLSGPTAQALRPRVHLILVVDLAVQIVLGWRALRCRSGR